MLFRRNLNARQNDKRRNKALSIGRLETLEARQVLSAVSEVMTQFDTSRVLVKFRDPAAIEPVKGTTLGDEVGLVPGLYTVNVLAGSDLDEVISAYQAQGNVEYAQHDFRIQVAATPNDPKFSSLYGMTKIAAPTAWDRTTGSPSIVVGVIDTGIDYNHPDLAANIWRNSREIPGNSIDDDGNGYRDDVQGWDFANNDSNPMDDNGHGTHVAGTIGAVGNNSVGVAGVAWNVKLMPLKFLTASGSGAVSGAISAINYAVQNGAKILNNSWGGGGYSTALSDAISRARAAGVIFVAAAGNEANNNDVNPAYPATYNFDNVVSVAATDSNDRLASFSNYGATTVDIAAPGVGILSTTPNNTYSSFSGTSMATPHVAGAAALVWAANPSMTYTQVIQRLYQSVDVVAGLNGKVATSGRLNVGRAVQGVPTNDTSAPRVVSAEWSGTTASTSSVTITFSEAVQSSTVTATSLKLTNPAGQAIAITSVTPVSGGVAFTVNFAAQTVAGNYKLTVLPTVKDIAGNLLNQDGDSSFGEATQDLFTSTRTLVAAPQSTTILTTFNRAIADNRTSTMTFTVTQAIVISDLDVRINLNHTYDSDLVIMLTSPSGKTVTLFNRRGGSGDNLTNTVFNDEASTGIAKGVAPFNGSYRPELALSAFDGSSTKGNWTLTIRDTAVQDVGTLRDLALIVTGTSTTTANARFVTEPVDTSDNHTAPTLTSTTSTTSTGPVGNLSPVAVPGLVAVTGQSRVTLPVPELTSVETPADTRRNYHAPITSVDLDSLFADLDTLLAE